MSAMAGSDRVRHANPLYILRLLIPKTLNPMFDEPPGTANVYHVVSASNITLILYARILRLNYIFDQLGT